MDSEDSGLATATARHSAVHKVDTVGCSADAAAEPRCRFDQSRIPNPQSPIPNPQSPIPNPGI
ncbi:hypothetical protein EIQ14_14410 [Xanthomonas campestris pv. campestris]